MFPTTLRCSEGDASGDGTEALYILAFGRCPVHLCHLSVPELHPYIIYVYMCYTHVITVSVPLNSVSHSSELLNQRSELQEP